MNTKQFINVRLGVCKLHILRHPKPIHVNEIHWAIVFHHKQTANINIKDEEEWGEEGGRGRKALQRFTQENTMKG